MKRISVFVMAVVLVLAFTVPAFATGAGGAGRDFGEIHSMHAQASDPGGFTGADNPGVLHHGFSGWTHI